MNPCCVCGKPYAPFGVGPPGVSPTREPDKFRWYCGLHRPCDVTPPSPPEETRTATGEPTHLTQFRN